MGTDRDAFAAARAEIGVYAGNAVDKRYGSERTGGDTGAKAKAGVGAAFKAAEEARGGCAVFASIVFVELFCGREGAGTADKCHLGLAAVAAENLPELLLAAVAAGRAERGIAMIQHKIAGVEPAVGRAAEPAVKTGEDLTDVVDILVPFSAPLPNGGKEQRTE